MKILRKRNNSIKRIRRCLGCILICYLLASWGVNGIINPIHYYRSTKMQMYDANLIEDDNVLRIVFDTKSKDNSYLSFEMKESSSVSWDAKIDVLYEEKNDKLIIELHKGLNTIYIPKEVNEVSISKDILEKNEVVFENFMISEYMKVDSKTMIETMISLFVLFCFWQLINGIKEKYVE